ncbi:MAG: sugar-binding transcriptional regulator [Chloroflexi bacterium]|nr:sugar-binding transcriptional regulator [Chloroflexota bacterium]
MSLDHTSLTEELRLTTKVAYLYYMQRLKQSDIAHQLDISQATVSRILKRAEEEDIVRITVNMPTGVYAQLESELCECYGLKAAIVVHCDDESDEAIFDHIGSAAAYYVETTINKNEVVGLSSWSSSLLAMVNAMHPLSKATDAKVVQILGGVGNPSAKIYASRITERFAKLVQGEAVYLPAPGVASSVLMSTELMNDPFVQQAVGLFDNVTLALVGIGSVEPSKLLASSGNVFTAEELTALQERGAVGDIVLRFFDGEGRPVVTPLNERVISMKLDQLKRVKRSVAIAGGPRKTNAIRGALLGGWINVLITDHMTAQRLLE